MVTMFAKEIQGEKRGFQLDNSIPMKKARIDHQDQSMPDELDRIARNLGLDANGDEAQIEPPLASNETSISQDSKIDEHQSLDQLQKSTLKHGP